VGNCKVGTIAVIATVAAGAAYLSTPSGQRSASTFTSAFSSSVSNSITNVKGWFSHAATAEQPRGEDGKFLPKEGGEANPGAAAEAAGLAAAGAAKNVSEVLNGTKRDGTGDGTGMAEAGQHVEVKSGEVIANTQQLAKMGQAAVDATGRALLVVTTNPNVKVTGPAQNNPNLDIRPHQ
jgi:hypothetical protein